MSQEGQLVDNKSLRVLTGRNPGWSVQPDILRADNLGSSNCSKPSGMRKPIGIQHNRINECSPHFEPLNQDDSLP